LPSAREESQDLARTAAAAAEDRKADRTVILDVGDVLAITDAFVITSGSNPRQVRAIADAVEEHIKILHDRGPLRTEGLRDLNWVLLDYGDVVVHIFTDEMRAFYEIERLYRDRPKIAWEPNVAGSEPTAGVSNVTS
jgi:ribosome-associated protein